MRSRFAWFDGALAEALAELFGMPIGMTRHRRTPPQFDAAEDFVIATMGFASQSSRGELTMLATPKTIRAITPVDLEDSDAAHCDVLAELTNVLLGWVKNGLLQRGNLIMLGIPSTVIARGLRFPESRDLDTSSWQTLAVTDEHELFVRLEAAFDETFDAAHAPSLVSSVGAPGTVLLF